MDNAVMKKDFPDSKQRLAVCFKQFRNNREDDSMQIHSFTADLEVRAENAEKGIFEGHASIFNVPFEHFFGSEVVLPGAFANTLQSKHPKKIKMLAQHDQSKMIGVWEELREDSKGLFVRGRLLTEIQSAKEALLLLKEGVLDSMSIGFRAVKENLRIEEDEEIRELVEVNLLEISLVAIPAQPDALVTSVRSASPEEITSKRDLERALRDAGFPVSTSKYITAGWTPPARRDVEGGIEDLAAEMRSVTKMLKSATGV